jgi:5'-deoxynucleotidase YfbR-like HD superfamily hydrolase
MASQNTLETVTGQLIDVTNIVPENIDLNDIAWSLSRIPRFVGHSITIVPYNVAQHSIFVAKTVQDWIANGSEYTEIANSIFFLKNCDRDIQQRVCLLALLHDAHEYITGDIPSPVKSIPKVKEIIKELEKKIDAVIRIKFDLADWPKTKYLDQDLRAHVEHLIKFADLYSRKIEAYTFIKSRGKDWSGLPEVSLEKLQSFEAPSTSIESYREFVKCFNDFSVGLKPISIGDEIKEKLKIPPGLIPRQIPAIGPKLSWPNDKCNPHPGTPGWPVSPTPMAVAYYSTGGATSKQKKQSKYVYPDIDDSSNILEDKCLDL